MEQNAYGGYIPTAETNKSTVIANMKALLIAQYYDNITGDDVRKPEKYMLPLESYELPFNNTSHIPQGEIYLSEVVSTNKDAVTMVSILPKVAKVLSGSQDSASSSSVSTTSSFIRNTFFGSFFSDLRNNLVDSNSDSYWEGSVTADISFDTENLSWSSDNISSDGTKEIVTVLTPVKAVKITFAGLLGESIKDSYGGNNAIDNALEEYLDSVLQTLSSTGAWTRSTNWSELSFFEKQNLLSIISSAFGGSVKFSHDTEFLSSAHLTTEASKPTWGLLIQHFFVCFLAAFMQLYFIKKSSSITNALQSGNVSMDRTHMLERRIGAAAGFAASAPIKAATGLAGAGAGAMINHAKDDRTAPLNDAR